MAEVTRLIHGMRQRAFVGVLVFEPRQSGLSDVDFDCDMVIELRNETTEGKEHYFLSYLSIVKSRFQRSALGWHQYKIREKGIEVFPSIHFRMHYQNPITNVLLNSLKPLGQPDQPCVGRPKSAQKSILRQLLGNGLHPNTCTVLSAREVPKTELWLDLLVKEPAPVCWFRLSTVRGPSD